jgi:ribosomal protein S18 acetylase RimI-like enzyme
MKAQPESSFRPARKIRSLLPRDLAAVVSIDAELAGRPRRAYFERRLAAAQRDPERNLQLAALEENGTLAGFMLGRALEGEFGRSEPAVRLEAFGVAAAAQGRGLGSALAAAFEEEAARRGLREIRTAALWREHALLRFLDRAGFRLGAAHVLDCALADAELGSSREAPLEPVAPPADPNDYGTPRPGDFGSLARDRIEVGLLSERDMEGVARVDRRHTGRDRRGYLCRTVAESLADSAVRVSLAARIDGSVAGFLMARVDYGDFGRTEPVAVIDTLGVDPLRARQGIGRALVSQLFMNLSGLGVERVETVVAAGNLDLLGFFCSAGFGPSERLAFVKRLQA